MFQMDFFLMHIELYMKLYFQMAKQALAGILDVG